MLPTPSLEAFAKLDNNANVINLEKNRKNIYLSNFKKLSNSLQERFNLTEPTANETANKVIELQKTLKNGRSLQIEATDLIPHDLILTKRYLIGVKKTIGEGSYAEVFKVVLFPTERSRLGEEELSPSQPVTKALKQAKDPDKTFSPENRMLMNRGLCLKKGIDSPLETFKIIEGPGCSLHELYDICLSKAEFTQMQAPVLAILQVLTQIASAIRTLHSSGLIHRDIKGANILVKVEAENLADLSPNLYKDKIKAVLTDFGLLKSESTTNHKTCGTPPYLDPAMFGDAKENLCNQKKRCGLQTKEGDIFAFGITIIYDVLLKFLTDKLQQLERTTEIDTEAKTSVNERIAKCKPKIKKGPFTDSDLQRLGEKYAFRAMHSIIDKKEELIIIYPQWSELKENLQEAIKILPSLTQDEINGLISISCLAYEMLETKPTINKVIDKLFIIRKLFKESFIPNSKKSGSVDKSEDPSPPRFPTQESSVRKRINFDAQPYDSDEDLPVSKTQNRHNTGKNKRIKHY